MNNEGLRVEFKFSLADRRPAPKPKPDPVVTAERLRQGRAARRARQLALAHHIDSLIRSEQVADLAAMARLCHVSRARISKVVGLLGLANADQERILIADVNGSVPSD